MTEGYREIKEGESVLKSMIVTMNHGSEVIRDTGGYDTQGCKKTIGRIS